MGQDELTRLREQILSDIVPLMLDTVEVGPDRFSLLLRLIQSGGTDKEIYKKAYESARAIEDKEVQLNALMTLLEEVDFDLQREGDEVSVPDEGHETEPREAVPRVETAPIADSAQY